MQRRSLQRKDRKQGPVLRAAFTRSRICPVLKPGAPAEPAINPDRIHDGEKSIAPKQTGLVRERCVDRPCRRSHCEDHKAPSGDTRPDIRGGHDGGDDRRERRDNAYPLIHGHSCLTIDTKASKTNGLSSKGQHFRRAPPCSAMRRPQARSAMPMIRPCDWLDRERERPDRAGSADTVRLKA